MGPPGGAGASVRELKGFLNSSLVEALTRCSRRPSLLTRRRSSTSAPASCDDLLKWKWLVHDRP